MYNIKIADIHFLTLQIKSTSKKQTNENNGTGVIGPKYVCHVHKNVTHKPIILYNQDVLIKTFLQDTGLPLPLDQPTIHQ